MFTQECFLRNARGAMWMYLEKLGYEPKYKYYRNNIEGSNLVCENQTWHFTDSDNKPNAIDCGTNEEMFLALAALRDDSDKFQLFVKEDFYEGKKFVRWHLCHSDKLSEELISYREYRKATPEEIVERFKKK